MYKSTSTPVCRLYAAGDLLHFNFMTDMLNGRRRGKVCVGGAGVAMDILQILFVKQKV